MKGDLSMTLFKWETIERLENLGVVKPGCKVQSCRDRYAAADPLTVPGEAHTASVRCQSGRRDHCTCDVCF